jgi:PAS domain S-box-containing protein
VLHPISIKAITEPKNKSHADATKAHSKNRTIMKTDGLQANLSESKKIHMMAQAGGRKLNLIANGFIFLAVMLFLSFQQTVAAESRRVKVGSDEHFPVIFQDKDGVAQGLYVDLLTEIGRKENIQFEYVFGTWDNTLNLIKSGRIDLLPGVAFSEERSRYMDYCKIPLLTVWGELYALQTSDIKSILDVSGKKIGVIKNDINARNFLELTKNFHIKCEFAELPGYEDVFKAVKTKTVDAGVVGISYGASKQGEYGLRSTGVVFNPYDLYFSTTKGKNQGLILILDKYLSEWRNQDISVLSNAKQKWIYGSVGTVAVAPVWMINTFVLLAIMISVSLTFITILKLQIQRATKTLRESESKQAKMLANIGDVIVIIDQNGINRYKSPNIEKWFGWKPEEVVGVSTWNNVHPEDIVAAQQFIAALMEKANAIGTTECRYRCKDGSYKWIEFAGVNLLHDPDIRGILGNYQDITERRQAEQEKSKLEVQLRQAQKMESIGSLAGGIAHDLNNILFPICGLSEMLLDDIPPDTPEHKSIEQIHKSAKRGSDLVKQILAFSRQSNPQKLPIRIQPILKEVLKLTQATIPRNIEIQSHINTDCGMVSADPTQIHQIAMNLITNAFHAVEQTGGKIHIALKETVMGYFGVKEDLPFPARLRDLLSGRYACITVSDTGTGINQTLIDKIFDPYFTTKELGKGTGLGLSVVHGIVKEHGGDIRVYSEVGKGTTFNVFLPLLEDTGDIKTATVIKQYPTGHERILLVDDEAPIVLLEKMMLEKLGYRITVRTSSPDALAAFKANPDQFDMVISDRGMPNMTGDQLAAELISIRPGIPIILCTGFSDDNDVKRAKAMGVKGFLMKPVATGDLAEMVRNVLDEVADNVQARMSQNPSGEVKDQDNDR